MELFKSHMMSMNSSEDIWLTYLQVITGAGHHVYADKAETFNRYVIEACSLSDSGETGNKLPKEIKFSSPPPTDLEGETSNTESEENIAATTGPNTTSPSLTKQSNSSWRRASNRKRHFRVTTQQIIKLQ